MSYRDDLRKDYADKKYPIRTANDWMDIIESGDLSHAMVMSLVGERDALAAEVELLRGQLSEQQLIEGRRIATAMLAPVVGEWRKKVAGLESALRNIYEACMAADAAGELDSRIDGEILDAAGDALKIQRRPKPKRRHCLTCLNEPEWVDDRGYCRLAIRIAGERGARTLKRYHNPDEVIGGANSRIVDCTGWEEKPAPEQEEK